jgi:ABC-type methionine transport system permease subunit
MAFSGPRRMTFNEQRGVFYHFIGIILFLSIVLTGSAVMLMDLSPLTPRVLRTLIGIAGIVLALTISLAAIFERVLRKAVAEGRVPR